MKITSILFMDQIEPSLDFWVGKLGFTKTVELPGFAILQKGDAELMLQTNASVKDDMPSVVPFAVPHFGGFVEIEDFAAILEAVGGLEVVVPERTTFYGMREIAVKEPGGNLIVFAARVA